MDKDPNDPTLFTLHRMVPPGSLTYFYSNNGEPSRDELQKEMGDGKEVKGEFRTFTDDRPIFKKKANLTLAESKQTVKIPKLNHIEQISQLQSSVVSIEELKDLKAKPRPRPKVKQEQVRPKSPWTFAKSIFAKYQLDTDEHLAKCFDFDWSCSKLDKILKNSTEKAAVYSYLKSNYRSM